jgi:hypothetical protein
MKPLIFVIAVLILVCMTLTSLAAILVGQMALFGASLIGL